jgi:hypothetical protein
MPPRSFAPLGLMGLSNAVFGMYGGILGISVPQLLSARHVAETTIAAVAASLLVLALFNLHHLALVEALLLTGYFFANLYQSALGGWLASIVAAEDQSKLSVWVTVGNIGAGGAMAMIEAPRSADCDRAVRRPFA